MVLPLFSIRADADSPGVLVFLFPRFFCHYVEGGLLRAPLSPFYSLSTYRPASHSVTEVLVAPFHRVASSSARNAHTFLIRDLRD